MKKFILRFGFFLLIMFVVDRIFGVSCHYMYDHVKSGEFYRTKCILESPVSDVLIMGSSRGAHHYDVDVIEDSLGLSCYNCAEDGNGILLQYARYREIKKRYLPKIIIYDILPEFDYLDKFDNHKFLPELRLMGNNDWARQTIYEVDSNERIKLASAMYQYNSQWYELIREQRGNIGNHVKGFLPVDDTLKYEPIQQSIQKYSVDSLKRRYLIQFANECKKDGVRLFFCVSPIYKAVNNSEYDEIMMFCEKNHLIFEDFRNEFTDRNMFYDPVHLNREGARLFTNRLVRRLEHGLHKKQ